MPNFQYFTLAAIRGRTNEPDKAVQGFLCDQLAFAIENYYVHLPQKRFGFAIDPVQALKLLRVSTETYGFSRRILQIIQSLHDRHTMLNLGNPLRSVTAFLPFMIERYVENGRPAYMLTKQYFQYSDIPLGARITHWNGMPIDDYVLALADQTNGANEAARLRLAVANLAERPLGYMLMPLEDWVTITFVDRGIVRTAATPWYCSYTPPSSAASATTSGDAQGATLHGIDYQLLHTNEFVRQVPKTTSERRLDLATDGSLRYGRVDADSGAVAYLRIFNFEVPDDMQFVAKIAAILSALPQDILIIDIRNNPGGLIPSGQKLVRILTENPLSPSPVEFRNTDSTLKLTQLDIFRAWNRSVALRTSTGLDFSQAIALSAYDNLPPYRYPGKIALVVDALAYSTSDFFSADFADNKVGLIVGVDPSTGGGGANVFDWDSLVSWSNLVNGGLSPLPSGFSFTLAGRRSLRTGANLGIPVEDFGVGADVRYELTPNDLLNDNVDLVRFTASVLRRTA